MIPGFESPLETRWLDDQRIQLMAPLVYRSALPGLSDPHFIVPTGFVSDFASVPRWIPLAFLLVGDIAHWAAVLHDWTYSIEAHCVRDFGDALLYEAACAQGVDPWRAWLLWSGVRAGGAPYYHVPDDQRWGRIARGRMVAFAPRLAART